jgi:hypothetical protein
MSKPILIHPFDLFHMLDSMPKQECEVHLLKHINSAHTKKDGLITVGDQVYRQTASIRPKTAAGLRMLAEVCGK